jgi:hypothetical protein
MPKNKTKFNPTFQEVLDFVTSKVTYDRDEPNGFDVKSKKKVKDVCIHMILSKDGDPKNMVEEDEVAGTCKCVVCEREFPMPDIKKENLDKLREAAAIINGTLLLLPWSDIGKKDATLALETRNALEQFIIMYEGGVNDITMNKTNGQADLTLKSHVSHL